jgi:hypothetical protein
MDNVGQEDSEVPEMIPKSFSTNSALPGLERNKPCLCLCQLATLQSQNDSRVYKIQTYTCQNTSGMSIPVHNSMCYL